MNKRLICLIVATIFTVFLVGCQSTKESRKKALTPEAPFLDENMEVFQDKLATGVDRNATFVGKTASLPVQYWDSFTDAFHDESDANPYGRRDPYYREDFKKDVLSESREGITQPEYLRGEHYSKAYRSPFIYEETGEHSSTTEMTTIAQAGTAQRDQRYMAFQGTLEDNLAQAAQYCSEGNYSDAMELVDKVLELDGSSQEAKILFEKIVRAREEDKHRQEAEMQHKVEMNKRISGYLSEARRYVDEGNYDEALRNSKKILSLDPTNESARELVDTIELSRFEADLERSGTSSVQVLEQLIHRHLKLYEQYTNEDLADLGKKELQKVAILESYRDKISSGDIELARFENDLKQSGISNLEVLEHLIHKHLKLYQEYLDDNVEDLAKKELQKVAVLETYRDRIVARQRYE